MKLSEFIKELQKLPKDLNVNIYKEVPNSWHYSDDGRSEYELSEDVEIEIHPTEGTIIIY